MTLYITAATTLAIYAIALHLRRRELLDKAIWVHQSAWGWSAKYRIEYIRWYWPSCAVVVTKRGSAKWEPGVCCIAKDYRTMHLVVEKSPGIVARRMLAHVRETERKAKEALK